MRGEGQSEAAKRFRVPVMENLEIFPKSILEPLLKLNWKWDSHIGLLERDLQHNR